jgi:hypothetical protein
MYHSHTPRTDRRFSSRDQAIALTRVSERATRTQAIRTRSSRNMTSDSQTCRTCVVCMRQREAGGRVRSNCEAICPFGPVVSEPRVRTATHAEIGGEMASEPTTAETTVYAFAGARYD